ncbi:MAG: hypothetical protein P1V97_25425 [Planctomycetota bacterium]|nr:hypothetical protein [Planctomycetota bacterium]
MGIIIEVIIEILVELILLSVGEFLIEALIRGISSISGGLFMPTPTGNDDGTTSYKVPPLLAATGYLILGAASGALSLLVLPNAMITNSSGQIANLIVTPFVGGAVMEAWGRFLKNKEKQTLRLNSFLYGFVLSLGIVLVRYFFAH